MSSDLRDKTEIEIGRHRSDATPVGAANASENPFVELGASLAVPAVNSFAPKMDFRVDLTMFRGPLDLLLYLVRKHELDIQDIPIALITDQYVRYMDVIEQLNVDEVGDFVEVASLLIEIKSRMVLP